MPNRLFCSAHGDEGIRTLDPLLARQVLSHLSYTPDRGLRLFFLPQVGLSGLEPPTSRLSGVRSNRLSYKPLFGLEEGSLASGPMILPSFSLLRLILRSPDSPLL